MLYICIHIYKYIYITYIFVKKALKIVFTVAFLTSQLQKAVGLPGCFSALPSTRVCSGHEKRQWVQDDSQGNGPGNKHGISIKEEAFYSTKQLSRSRVKTAEAPPAPPRGWQRRDLLSNRWGERGGDSPRHLSPSQAAANDLVR